MKDNKDKKDNILVALNMHYFIIGMILFCLSMGSLLASKVTHDEFWRVISVLSIIGSVVMLLFSMANN